MAPTKPEQYGKLDIGIVVYKYSLLAKCSSYSDVGYSQPLDSLKNSDEKPVHTMSSGG